MAEFSLWQKETLITFAEESTAKIAAQEREIKQLQSDVQALHMAWKDALREIAATATVKECSAGTIAS